MVNEKGGDKAEVGGSSELVFADKLSVDNDGPYSFKGFSAGGAVFFLIDCLFLMGIGIMLSNNQLPLCMSSACLLQMQHLP